MTRAVLAALALAVGCALPLPAHSEPYTPPVGFECAGFADALGDRLGRCEWRAPDVRVSAVPRADLPRYCNATQPYYGCYRREVLRLIASDGAPRKRAFHEWGHFIAHMGGDPDGAHNDPIIWARIKSEVDR